MSSWVSKRRKRGRDQRPQVVGDRRSGPGPTWQWGSRGRAGAPGSGTGTRVPPTAPTDEEGSEHEDNRVLTPVEPKKHSQEWIESRSKMGGPLQGSCLPPLGPHGAPGPPPGPSMAKRGRTEAAEPAGGAPSRERESGLQTFSR